MSVTRLVHGMPRVFAHLTWMYLIFLDVDVYGFKRTAQRGPGLSYRTPTVVYRFSSVSSGSSPLSPPSDLAVKIVNSIEGFGREAWNSLLNDKSSPFLEYDWLHALEASGCVTVQEGWQPVHVGVYRGEGGALVAACPLYVKSHSQGEFIFDHSWADYCERALGQRYYPKLLSAVPFTPATGSRLLVHPSLSQAAGAAEEGSGSGFDAVARAVAGVLQQLVRDNGLSSAHVNFMRPDELAPYLAQGFQLRETIQYRWENVNRDTGRPYADFDEYLGQFKSKRRMQVRTPSTPRLDAHPHEHPCPPTSVTVLSRP